MPGTYNKLEHFLHGSGKRKVVGVMMWHGRRLVRGGRWLVRCGRCLVGAGRAMVRLLVCWKARSAHKRNSAFVERSGRGMSGTELGSWQTEGGGGEDAHDGCLEEEFLLFALESAA